MKKYIKNKIIEIIGADSAEKIKIEIPPKYEIIQQFKK